MKKIITVSTLTAGIGVSAFGLNIHHADAAELTQNQFTHQANQQHQNNNGEQQNLNQQHNQNQNQQHNQNQQQNQNQFQKQNYNQQQTSQSSLTHQAHQINHSNLNNQRYQFSQSNYINQNQPTQQWNQHNHNNKALDLNEGKPKYQNNHFHYKKEKIDKYKPLNTKVHHYNTYKSKSLVTNNPKSSHFTNIYHSNNHTNATLNLASHTKKGASSSTSTISKLNSVSNSATSSNSRSSSTSNSSSVTNTSTKTTSSTKNNLYTAGQCTWYVYDKVNGAIGSTWGNANNWANAAKAAGYTVNHTAEAGSILQTTAGSLGHVAYVESVNSDGSITISEMNYTGGAYVTDTRTISASEVSSYNYIHLS